MFLGSVPPAHQWAMRAMTYIGIKVRLVQQVTILDPDSEGRISLRFGARTVTLPRAVLSLLEEGQNQILLNLASINTMHTDGFRELVSTLTRVKDRGGQMKVAQLTPRLAELMTDAKVLQMFDVYESESQAVDSFHNRAIGTAWANSSDAAT